MGTRNNRLSLRGFLVAVFVSVIVLMAVATAASANVINCAARGTTLSGNSQAGFCNTDQNSNPSMVVASNSNLTATVAAKGGKSAQQNVGFWSSNGFISATTSVCVFVNTGLPVDKGGSASLTLKLGYNNGIHTSNPQPVGPNGIAAPLCYYGLPAGATNVTWQVLADVTAPKTAQQTLVVTLTGLQMDGFIVTP
jgi:hypothetical protein